MRSLLVSLALLVATAGSAGAASWDRVEAPSTSGRAFVYRSAAAFGEQGVWAAGYSYGTIGGALRCRGMDDIPEHQEQISGSYTRDAFRLTIDMPVHGAVVRQTIEARRTGYC